MFLFLCHPSEANAEKLFFLQEFLYHTQLSALPITFSLLLSQPIGTSELSVSISRLIQLRRNRVLLKVLIFLMVLTNVLSALQTLVTVSSHLEVLLRYAKLRPKSALPLLPAPIFPNFSVTFLIQLGVQVYTNLVPK